jgi:peptidyl-prolyl cis-trans isomerase B (cyclophilin B)
MTRKLTRTLALLLAAVAHAAALAGQGRPPEGGIGGPVIVVETVRGVFEFETYPNEAPQTVAHLVALADSGFYDGQRVHRAIPGFVAQFGDPQSRDLAKRDVWGKGAEASSGKPVGVAEIARKRNHRKGAVAMAHPGEPAKADSQIYVTLADRPELNGKYAVIGQVISGVDVPASLQVGDVITKVYVKR